MKAAVSTGPAMVSPAFQSTVWTATTATTAPRASERTACQLPLGADFTAMPARLASWPISSSCSRTQFL